MKKIIVLVLCLSMVCCLLAGCGEGVKTPTSETPSNELSPTQEALKKEYEEIKKLLSEKNPSLEQSLENDIYNTICDYYKLRLIETDKVDNFYRFEKDSMKDFKVVSAGNYIIIKNSDGYFGWGKNGNGALTTDENKIIKRSVFDLYNEFNRDMTKGVVEYFVPSDVEVLKGATVGITKDGRICLWRDMDYVQTKPITYIEHEDKIIDCFRNKNTIYYITEKGEIFANEEYYGGNISEFFPPTTVECQKIYKITAEIEAESFCNSSSFDPLVVKDKKGDYYTYVIKKDDKKPEYAKKEMIFEKIKCPEKIADVKTAYNMIYILTEKGNIYCQGENWAQLFEGEKFDKIEMKKLDLGIKVKDFSADEKGIIFTNYEGNLYAMGKGNSLETRKFTTEEWLYDNYDYEAPIIKTPQKIDIPDKVIEFGGVLHSGGICKTKSGDVYVWGRNYFGQHLNGTRWSDYSVTKITK